MRIGSTRPWLDVDSFVARIMDWFDQAESGWPQDTPDLDLDRCFDPASPRLLVLYEDLELLLERSIRTRRGHNQTVEVTGAGPAARKAKRRGLRFGYCADIGTPAKPPKRWSDLEPLIRDGKRLRRASAADVMDCSCCGIPGPDGKVSWPSPPSRARTTRLFFEHICRPEPVLRCDGCALASMHLLWQKECRSCGLRSRGLVRRGGSCSGWPRRPHAAGRRRPASGQSGPAHRNGQ